MENNISEQKEKNLNEFEIDTLVKTTFNKIAAWHNDEPTSISLKHLTLELIEEIAGEVFKHFGISYTSSLKMDTETKNKINKFKNDNNIPDTKSIEQMSDSELMAELNKRKLKKN